MQNDKIIFSAAFENSNEKLYEIFPKNLVDSPFCLRRNAVISDSAGRECWHESQVGFESIDKYLDSIETNLPKYAPLELDERFSSPFKHRLFKSVRESGFETERAFFNLSTSFNGWMRWLKLFHFNINSAQPSFLAVNSFMQQSPVIQIQIDLVNIRIFQELLDVIYAAMMFRIFKTGQYEKRWLLYNLTQAKPLTGLKRHKPISPNHIACSDEIAVLRLHSPKENQNQ